MIQKAFLTIFFLLLFAASSFATEITISATTISNWTFGGATASIRIYPNKTFVTSTNTTILAGTASGFYKTINCTVAGTVVSCPSFVIDSTTDSSVPTVVYIADLYDSTGRSRGRYFDGFRVPTSLGLTVTWEQLRTYNVSIAAALPTTFYTSDQTNLLVAGKQNTLVSGTNIKTINSQSLLGSGDLVVSGAIETIVSNTTELDAAIVVADANPTLKYNFVLDASPTISTGKTIPANVFIKPLNGSKITFSGTGSVACAGMCLADSTSPTPVFGGLVTPVEIWPNPIHVNTGADTISGLTHGIPATGTILRYGTYDYDATAFGGLSFGQAYYAIVVNSTTFKLATTYANAQAGTAIDITSTGLKIHRFTTTQVAFTGSDWPREVASEIFDTGDTSASKRLLHLAAAFGGKQVEFQVHPRTFTTAVWLHDYQSVLLLPGEHQNTFTHAVGFGFFPYGTPFSLGSHSSFRSEPGAIAYGSNVDYFNSYIATRPGSTGVVVEGNHFKGQDIQFDGVKGGVAFSACTNCHIRNNWFDAFENYNASIVSSGGLHSQDSSIEGNLVTGYLTQNLHFGDCERCSIRNNRLTFRNVGVIGSVIDLEPNSTAEFVDDLVVENNYIYFKNNQLERSQVIVPANITTAGNARSVVTAAGMTGSPKTVTFAVALNDTAEQVAIKLVAALRADPDVSAFFDIKRINVTQIYIVKKTEAATDATINFTIEDVTSAGITDDVDSDDDSLGTTVYGITANPAATRGFRRLIIRNNTIVNDGRFQIATGISVGGANVFEISGNKFVGVSLYPIVVTYSANGKIFNNHAPSTSGRAFYSRAIGDTDWYNNTVGGSPINNDLEEFEAFSAVNSSGTTMTFSYTQASFYAGNETHAHEAAIGRTIEFNNSTYTVSTVTPSDTFWVLTTTAALPTLSQKTFTASGTTVIVGTDTIDFGVAHGMATGGAFFYDFGGTRIGGLNDDAKGHRKFYIINTGANTIKVAATKALALAGTAIDLTSTGSGLQLISPAFETRFSNNRYRDNDIPGGIILEPTGTSVISSNFTDRVAAAPATTADNAIVRWDGTTGRAIQNSGPTIDDSGILTLSRTNGFDQVQNFRRTADGVYRLSILADGDFYFGNGGGTTNTVVEANNTSGRQFKAEQSTVTPLSVKLHASQSANAFEVQPSGSTTPLSRIDASGNVFAPSINIGTGTAIVRVISATASLDFTALAANSCEGFTITVTGTADGDTVSVGIPNALASLAGTIFSGYVSAANTVTIRRCNVSTGATSDPGAETVRATIMRF